MLPRCGAASLRPLFTSFKPPGIDFWGFRKPGASQSSKIFLFFAVVRKKKSIFLDSLASQKSRL